MHTIICVFDDVSSAERARERLVRSGVPEGDVHLETSSRGGTAGVNRGDPDRMTITTDSSYHTGAGHGERDSGLLGRFFGNVVPDMDVGGRPSDDSVPQRRTYEEAFRGGRTLLLIESHDDGQAEACHAVLEACGGRELHRRRADAAQGS